MRYYPISLDIQNRKCLVVGGGSVGTRKVMTLLECGATVSVVSIEATEKLQELSTNGQIRLERRPFKPQIFMVISLLWVQRTTRK